MSGKNSSPKKRENVASAGWDQINRRLEAARVAIERTGMPSAEETQKILNARALVLAEEPALDNATDDNIEIVEFIIANERYAIETQFVCEVCPLRNLTPVPCTPRFVLGIVNMRGEILSVIDLKKFFDLPQRGLTDLDKVLVLSSGSMRLGILADVIVGVRHISLSNFQTCLPTLTGVREKYLRGVTAERLVVLDAERLLMDEGIVVHEQVAG